MEGSIVKKRTKILAAAGVVAVALGVGGFAFADFVPKSEATADSAAAKFAPVTVTGTVAKQDLLPTETSNVTLAWTVPSGNNVSAKVTAIEPAGVVVDPASVGGDGNLAYGCSTFVVQKTNHTSNATFPTLAPGASTTFLLNDGITLGDAPATCQGMTFKTKWTVSFSPVRSS